LSVRDVLKGYLALTKPRIIELLLITTVPTMIVAANGWIAISTPSWNVRRGARS
jgi:heme O synthase-like polyprenyltransferase